MNNPTLEVYDPAMCCSTGVCGPSVDPKLIQFAADLKWLEERGVEVRRFNLAQNPMAFVQNKTVNAALAWKNEGALPLLLVNGRVVASRRYAQRDELVAWLGIDSCCDGKAEGEKPRSTCCGDRNSQGSTGCC